ncbi:putative non-specific lipid-transfer protein 14 [Elaeis guineensis]|uniref:putative non-specific lipid-transfer protein 14 n=1 Tax=Elaeis guineensis var. tenera TaxID=51953 RepID=UPI003C6CD788
MEMGSCGKRWLGVLVLVLVLGWATAVAGLMDCSTVTSLLSTCSNFATYGTPDPTLGTPCCDGVVSLYNIASDSTDNRRSACSCLMALITTYNPNATAIARLPGLCGISLGFIIDPNTDCTM